ncbi:alpha/beta fold hydrolase [Asanoa sp. WMMD1127]|uniref:alpha/beta fold hydrolase n=1 Tax=Asanoa sp. WMMD1127 TaxID=3016107 RepID=UPI002416BC9C|nr:alpha/beta fold hydrolase [Asanoa sp. WMMD1127]MDG4826705.1 alpha/beta fold hydrolase [Asanoa sp. WMMD1127]
MSAYVTSRDGTTIAYTRLGAGPLLVLVGGGLDDGAENAPLATELSRWFTVVNYARRGRGASGDTQPYAVDREIDDLAALLAPADGSALLFGASSGGALALTGAAAGLPVARVAVYEIPYLTDEPLRAAWLSYVEELRGLLALGRRGDAVAAFMRLAGAGDAEIAGARALPIWPSLEALAPTLAYDAACLGDGRVPASLLAGVGQPVLVATGAAADPHLAALGPSFFETAADELVAALPHAERAVVENSGHVADPTALAPLLHRFFTT